MQVWRICKRIYKDTSFSGIGGLKGSMRWHHKGHLIVYTSSSLSLATLESWVQPDPHRALTNYVSVCAHIPDDLLVERIDEAILPMDWRTPDSPGSSLLRDIGTEWLLTQSSAVLRVPSAVTISEFNYLLNPAHAGFREIQQQDPVPFEYDRRMWRTKKGSDDLS